MSVPNVYGVPIAKVAGDTLGSSEVNALGKSVNLFAVRLAELFGAGAFASTDFNGTIVPGELALELSEGDALVGATGQMALVFQEGAVMATEDHGIVASATNYFYLNRDGSWTVVQDTDDAPANSHLMVSAVFGTTEATSVNSNPLGRSNILPFPSDGLVYTSATDTVRKFLKDSITSGTGITVTEEAHPDGGTRLKVACTVTADDHKVMTQAGDTAKYLYDAIKVAAGSGLSKSITGSAGNYQVQLDFTPGDAETFSLLDLDSYELTIPAGTQKSIRVQLGKGAFASGAKYLVTVSHVHAKDKVRVLVDATKTGTEFWVLVQNASDSGLSSVTLDFLVYGYGLTETDPPVAETFTPYDFNFPEVPAGSGGGPYGTTVAFPLGAWTQDSYNLSTSYTQAPNRWANGAFVAEPAAFAGEARSIVCQALDGSAADVEWTLFRNGVETVLTATTQAVNGEGIGIASPGLVTFAQGDRLELRAKKLTGSLRVHSQQAVLLVKYN